MNDFLFNDYKLKTDYLSAHFSRMWTRFNFFLTLNSALFALTLGANFPPANVILAAIVGIVLSLVWFYFGATDNSLARIYREKINQAYSLFKTNLEAANQLVLKDSLAAGDLSDQKGLKGKNLLDFRLSWLSITELSAVLPIAYLIFWIIRAFYKP